MSERTASITHAEYEILNHLIENINLHELRASMCNDKVSASRFDKAADNVAELIEISKRPQMDLDFMLKQRRSEVL